MSENKGDIISRESLLRHIGSVDDAKADAEADPELSEAMKWLLVRCVEHATDIINAEPTVDARPVVRTSYEDVCLCGGFAEKWGYRCGNCDSVTEINPQHCQKPEFCPMCGAEWSRGERQ